MLTFPALLGDNCERLWKIYLYIMKKLHKKCYHDVNTIIRCNKLESEFLELYERAKAKEKVVKEEKRNKTQEPFYYIRCASRRNQRVFERLKFL